MLSAPASVKLYDGQTARAWPVLVALSAEALQVQAAELPAGTPKIWPLAEVRLEAVTSHGFLGIRYGTLALESTDEALNRALLRRLRVGGMGAQLTHWAGASVGAVVAVLLLVVGLAVGAWQWGIPWVATRAVALVPRSLDRELGRRAAAALLQQEAELPEATRALRAFGHAMRLDTNAVRLHVLQSNQRNAFALPGGEVFLYTALADSLRSPGELAALLGHELAHVERRHGVQMLARGLAGYLVAAALLGDVGGVATVLLDGAQQLGRLSYSRSLEAEADELGCRRLVQLGYSPTAMADLFRRLAATAETGAQPAAEAASEPVSEILSDHPNLTARIAYATRLSQTLRPAQAPAPALAASFATLQRTLQRPLQRPL